MRKNIVFLAILFLLMVNFKIDQVEKVKFILTEVEFAQKIKETPNAILLDVRTPEEFSEGHLKNAKNIDWNGNHFDEQTAKLDKSKPVLVYCRSGARSASAAARMRSVGFKEVYELNGGILAWIAANLPVTSK